MRERLQRYPRQFWLMAAGVFVSNFGGSLVWPFLLIYVSATLELPLAAVGSLVTIQASVAILASFGAGTLADRVGRRVVMIASLAGSACVYLLLAGASSYLEFAVLMVLLGISNPLYQVGADAMVADLVPPERRAEAFSITRIASNAGFGLGPAIGGFLAAASYDLAFLGAAVGFGAYALLLLLRARETLPRPAARAPATRTDPGEPLEDADRGQLLKDGGQLAVAAPAGRRDRGYARVFGDRRFAAFIVLIGIGLIAPSMMWILLAVYTKTNYGLPESLFGWIPTTNAALCVFAQYPVTRLTRRFPPLAVVTAGMGIYALGAGSVALMSGFWGFWTSMVILTFGELLLIPTAAKHIADRAAPDLRGRYMSAFWLSHAASRAVAPLVGGFLNDHVGPPAIWYGALAIGMSSTAGLALLTRQQGSRQLVAEDQGVGSRAGRGSDVRAAAPADAGSEVDRDRAPATTGSEAHTPTSG